MAGSPGKGHHVESHMVSPFSVESVTIILCCLQTDIASHAVITKRHINDKKLFVTTSYNFRTIFYVTPMAMFTTSTLNNILCYSEGHVYHFNTEQNFMLLRWSCLPLQHWIVFYATPMVIFTTSTLNSILCCSDGHVYHLNTEQNLMLLRWSRLPLQHSKHFPPRL